jgi:hypothetical protein
VGLLWTVLIRVPLIQNAEDHLDSDLAVDGLTLLDALNGHWRWHFPGTPHMGILPMLLSYPQALHWGASAVTLVSGGTVIWVLVVASTFWLARRSYGLEVAGWAIVPLVFSSLGTIWLSGRLTGGHLLTLAWHNLAFAGLYSVLTAGGFMRAAILGIWCGLGVYLDAMFLCTLAGLGLAAIAGWLDAGRSRSGVILAGVILGGALIGLLPREIGRRIDRYDAYPSQFAVTFEKRSVSQHAWLLGQICTPRLIAGIEIPALAREIARVGSSTSGAMRSVPTLRNQPTALRVLTRFGCGALSLTLLVISLIWLARDLWSAADRPRRAVCTGILASAFLITAAFLVNRNIYNSDNYRYLVFLLTPWALGFGSLMRDIASSGWFGRLAAVALAFSLGALMTMTALDWYQRERRYLGPRLIPVRVAVRPWNQPMIADPHPATGAGGAFFPRLSRDVTHVFGPYWDVYRISFLSGGRVIGIPFPMYPNRFQGWSHGLSPSQGKLMVLPWLSGWREALATVWRADGRDPAELSHLRVIAPSRESSRP